MGIFDKKSFNKQIRNQRCQIIADAFIEGTTKERLDKPYVVYLKDHQRPFAMAGIWDSWVNKETGEVTNSFAIITTVNNELLARIPHHRSPVILHREDEQDWLSPDLSDAETAQLLRPYPAKQMNAYPVSNEIKHPAAKGIELMAPIGERLTPEFDIQVERKIELQGMGKTRREEKLPF